MKKDRFDGLVASMQQALAHSKGQASGVVVHRAKVEHLDVAQLRTKLHMSQESFADLFRVPIGTVRNWEQGRNQPTGPARVLLQAINTDPKNVLRAIWPDWEKKEAKKAAMGKSATGKRKVASP